MSRGARAGRGVAGDSGGPPQEEAYLVPSSG
jgi:hypothetical protein